MIAIIGVKSNIPIGGITRLVDMGVERFLVANAVRAFIAQRLVRVLCTHCKRTARHLESYLQHVGFPSGPASGVMAAAGCQHCRQTGFHGRAALFEICLVSAAIQDLIVKGAAETVLHALALEEGMIPLRRYGWSKVLAGETTVEEVVRVTAADLELMDE